MRVQITVEVCEGSKDVCEAVAVAVLTLEGELVQSVRLGQWIEQTKSRLCKEVMQQLKKREECRILDTLIDPSYHQT